MNCEICKESLRQGARGERSTSFHNVPAVSAMPALNSRLLVVFTPNSDVVGMPANNALGGPNLLALSHMQQNLTELYKMSRANVGQ